MLEIKKHKMKMCSRSAALLSTMLLITQTNGFSAKTPIETMLTKNIAVDNGNLEIGSDQSVVLISHMHGDSDNDEDMIQEGEVSTTDDRYSESSQSALGGSMMWMLLAMCCCLPLCAYMYMRSRRNAQMQGDGFNRVGGFGGGGFGGGYGGGYNGYDDDGRPPPPGTRYIVVQRGAGQGFANGSQGVPIGGQPGQQHHFGAGPQ